MKLMKPDSSAERTTAALHACEGLITSDLAGNERGWLAGLVNDVHRIERENNQLLDAVCVGNKGCDLKARCQSYEASEQRDPCPPGCCAMADEKDVRALLAAIDSEDGTPSAARRTTGLRDFIENGCDARPEDRHHALQELDALEQTHVHGIGIPPGLHPKTAQLVLRFATALAEKLKKAEDKYGYDDGWSGSAWMEECQLRLAEHVQKGDPRDVAAYCAFMWHHGWPTKASVPSSAERTFQGEMMSDTPRTDALQQEWATDGLTWEALFAFARELERDANYWVCLPLLHPMDIATEVMGAAMPQDLRRGLEARLDRMMATYKSSAAQKSPNS